MNVLSACYVLRLRRSAVFSREQAFINPRAAALLRWSIRFPRDVRNMGSIEDLLGHPSAGLVDFAIHELSCETCCSDRCGVRLGGAGECRAARSLVFGDMDAERAPARRGSLCASREHARVSGGEVPTRGAARNVLLRVLRAVVPFRRDLLPAATPPLRGPATLHQLG